ncbi:MAG: tRNA lysidine(34) synthetase TilS [Terriglobia bacterium]
MSRQSETYSRWSLEMRRGGFFHAGDRVGVAVSGGPDSILLLDYMNQLARELGFTLAVVHFNHHLRGAESDADEHFVRERAGQLGIDFLPGQADVARVAREKRRNLEATARELRYRFFFSLVNQGRLDKVATAHTANDQAETVLLRLLRGAGSRGLGGIYPLLEGKVVRPFLNVTRAEVEQELEKRKLEWRLDSSNLNSKFRRNKIRKELLPLLQKEFNPEVIGALKELSDRARDDEEYLEGQARERARAWRVREGQDEKIPIRPLIEFPAALARRVLRQMILASRGNLRGVTYKHIEALRRFAHSAQSGRMLELPGGWEARKEFDWLIIAPEPRAKGKSDYCYPVQIPGEISIPQSGLTVHFKIVGSEGPPKAYNTSGWVELDLLKLSGPLVLRNWRAGDRYRTTGSRKVRNLKELFARRKIPPGQRKVWPVLVCGEEIVWVKDFLPASDVAASTDSKRIMIRVDRTESNLETTQVKAK